MPQSIRPVRVNHINAVVENFDASVAHMQGVYGGLFLADLPHPELHACLIDVGRVILEFFVPTEYLLSARYGPHYLGVEYQADMDEVREAIAGHGIRIVRDGGVSLHTHPADCFGIAFEFWNGYFHDNPWPLTGGKMKPPEYWRDEHPLGLTGLLGYTVATQDLQGASRFFASFLSAAPIYETSLGPARARAKGLQVADAVVEVMAPDGDGAVARHLVRYGQGIRSTVFGVRDLGQARRYFEARGVATAPGDRPDSFAIPAEANLGLIFEFTDAGMK